MRRTRARTSETTADPRDASPELLLPSEVPRAWSESPGWCGPPELLARIPRAAILKIEDLEGARPSCQIDVHVPLNDSRYQTDVEHFDSPEEFLEGVTVDALRKLAAVTMDIKGRTVHVYVALVRKNVFEIPASHVGPGVHLYVLSPDPDVIAPVLETRDVVLSAIERGRNWRHRKPSRGEINKFGKGISVDERRDPRLPRVFAAIGVALLLGISTLTYNDALWSSNWMVVGAMGAVALAGGFFLSLAALSFFPSIEIATASRSDQLRRGALKAGLLAAGPLVGIALNQLVVPRL